MNAADVTWIGVAMSFIALIGTIANNVVSYFKDRDKLKYDRKVIELENHVADCNEHHKATTAKLQLCEEQHRESADRHEDAERRLAALERARS